ncbi:MAG: CrcB family protein [Corynebacterium sp.]|nr:CrcB family protein [Corynebacterium sp.]
MTIISIIIGAFIGGCIRYGLTLWANAHSGNARRATFGANMIACLVLGLVSHGAFLATGLCGALSTWSTLAKELGTLIQARDYRTACAYGLLSVICGLILFSLGALIHNA